jgi:hypothetical protein
MHGIVNRGLQLFLIEEYGEEFWRELAVSLDQESGFEALLMYDDEVTRRLMTSVARRLNCTRAEIWEGFGAFLTRSEYTASFWALLRFGGRDFSSFFHRSKRCRRRCNWLCLIFICHRSSCWSRARGSLNCTAVQGYGAWAPLPQACCGLWRKSVKFRRRWSCKTMARKHMLARKQRWFVSPYSGPRARNRHDGWGRRRFMPDVNTPEVLDHLCPLHLRLNAAGQIVHLGPTLNKLGLEALVGETFDDVFAIERPGAFTSFEHLTGQASTRAQLKLRNSPGIAFKAAVVPTKDDIIVTLSFGTGTRAAVENLI